MSERNGHCGQPTKSDYPCLLGRQPGEDGCRWHKSAPDQKVVVWLHPKVVVMLDALLDTGLFGQDRSDAADRLICDGLIRRGYGMLEVTP